MIPKIELTNIGYRVPTTQEINDGVWEMLDSAMGGDLSKVQGTFQYQFATSFTAIVRDSYDQLVEQANQFDPRYAQGKWQDAIGEIYFIDRKLATKSVATVVFRGLSGVIIPSGFIIQDVNGNQWATTGVITIGSNSQASATVQCVVGGAIIANANTINIIPSALNGLDSVNNELPAITGINEESPQDFELRRQESVSANAKMTDGAVRGSVSSLNDVVDVYVYSNNSDAPITIGFTNYQLEAHSIVVSVVGGVDYDIAMQTLIKAGTGCGFNGNTLVVVSDTDTYPQNPPTYNVKFLRPELTGVYWRVTLVDISKMSLANQTAIQDTILNGMKTGATKGRIGGNLRPISYVSSVASSVPNLDLETIEVSRDGSAWVNILEFGVDEFPVSSIENISIV